MMDLKETLMLHQLWIDNRKDGVRANLWGANLGGANLMEANLGGANLWGADLRGANLWGANLCAANLMEANLMEANLMEANLCAANLRGANLMEADLREANLMEANLCAADLRGANLGGANLGGANLSPFQIVPEEGSFIGYKKLKDRVVIKLEIPFDAKRTSSLVGRKCRASYVKVLEGSGISSKGGEYKEGELYYPDSYNDDIRVECTNGVHFFITKEEAEEYIL